jgi:hypothetical protein
MTKRRQRDDDDDAFENGVMREGARYSVPLRLMDSMQRDVARHYGRLVDTDGNASLRQPGFAPRDATESVRAARKALDDQYLAYDAAASSEWSLGKSPPIGVGSHGFVGCEAGDLCTVRSGGGAYCAEGAAGRLKVVNGELQCVADGFDLSHARDATSLRDEREAAYQGYQDELATAWRRG